MKLLITGALGQLGQDLIRTCKARGLDYLPTDFSELDIACLPDVRRVVGEYGPDFILNCAAYNLVDQAEKEPYAAMRVNGIGPRNLAIVAEEQDVGLMHFSTDYVFDGKQREPYTIMDRPQPINRYGQSKLLGEDLVRSLCNRHFVVRLSWLFGGNGDNFVRKVLRWAKAADTVKIVIDQVANPTYSLDAAAAAIDILESGAYGLYHLTNAESCSRFEWAYYIREYANLKVELEPVQSDVFPQTAARPVCSVLDNYPLEETIGHELPDWQDATRRYLRELGAFS